MLLNKLLHLLCALTICGSRDNIVALSLLAVYPSYCHPVVTSISNEYSNNILKRRFFKNLNSGAYNLKPCFLLHLGNFFK